MPTCTNALPTKKNASCAVVCKTIAPPCSSHLQDGSLPLQISPSDGSLRSWSSTWPLRVKSDQRTSTSKTSYSSSNSSRCTTNNHRFRLAVETARRLRRWTTTAAIRLVWLDRARGYRRRYPRRRRPTCSGMTGATGVRIHHRGMARYEEEGSVKVLMVSFVLGSTEVSLPCCCTGSWKSSASRRFLINGRLPRFGRVL